MIKKDDLVSRLGTEDCPLRVEVGFNEHYCVSNVEDCYMFNGRKSFCSRLDKIFWGGCSYDGEHKQLGLFDKEKAEENTLFCVEHNEVYVSSANGKYCPKCTK